MKTKHILSFLLLLSTITLYSQQYFFDQYGVKEGLAQSKVYDIIQDEKGFIWLGTASGVSRFDGLNFENFSADDGLADNGVKVIFQDNENNIWLGHIGGGVTRFNGTKFEKVKLDSIPVEGDITEILQDSSRNIWVATHGSGAYLINNPNEDIKHISVLNYKGQQKLSDRIFSMLLLKNGRLLFIIDGGIKYYLPKEKSFEFFSSAGLPLYFQFTTLFEDRHENLWLGTYNGGLYKLVKETGEVKIFDVRDGLAHNFISTINEDNAGNIWVGTWGGGITLINEKLKTYNTENGLSDNKIRCITEDREGNILIGTNENGLSIFRGEQFISYQSNNGLNDKQVSSIFMDKSGNYWFGTMAGLNFLNHKNQIKKVEDILVQHTEFNKEVMFIEQDKNDVLWLGTKHDGVYSLSLAKGRLEYNPKINININGRGRGGLVTGMAIDNDNALWIGTIDGLVYFDINTGNLANLSNIHGLAGNDISAVFCDSKNNIWVGSKGKGITKIIDTVFTKIDSTNRLTVKSFTEDNKGNIWFGTESKGVFCIENDVIIKNLNQNHGLIADYITLVKDDGRGSIWIGTNNGLNRYIISENKVISYTKRSGFTGIEVKDNAAFLDDKQNMWFGTVDGVFKFNPNKERINTFEPLTHILKMSVNLQEKEMKPGLTLNYPEKSVVFNYNSICLTDPDKVFFKVMLEGADISWQPPTKQTFANYSPLPAGHYKFKVIASNNMGIWNSEPVTFEFNKKPPFWKTKLFYFIVIVVIIIVLVFYIKIREQNLKKEKAILEKKVKERTQEVVQKNKELAQKNQNIMDSIKYAKRIQSAMLPGNKLISEHLKDAFVLYKPKDIVSGDFYWVEKIDNKILFSAVDCTGHGVPGALMSVVGFNGLHRIVSEFKLTKPSEILDKLNELVKETLQSSQNTAIKDGMDMALCVLDRENKKLEYAGAFNPLYLISSNDELFINSAEKLEPKMTGENLNLFEIKGSKQPIGAYFKSTGFTNHSIELKGGETVYVFSDGYADQFGGPKGKKFMYKQLKQLLLDLQSKEMEMQKEILNNTIEEWMANAEQIDDICLIGVKI